MSPFVFVALLLSQESDSAQRSSVEGIVVNAVSKAPVRKATVTLQCGGFLDRVQSGAGGNFRFASRPDGRCRVAAYGSGFINNEIAFEAGAKAGLVVSLTPHAALSGRVLDEDGDPVHQATVYVEPVSAQAREAVRGTGGGVSYTGTVATDDKGEFRVFGLGAAKYRILAKAPPGLLKAFERRDEKGELVAPRNDEQDFAPTYFPNAGSIEEAAIVTLAAGEDRRGLDIRLQKNQLYTVSGRVRVPAGWKHPPAGFIALTRSNGGSIIGTNDGSASIGKNGTFEIRGVTPGEYKLYASLAPQDEGSPHLSVITKVTVTAADVSGLEISFHYPVLVSGSITFRGGKPNTERLQVQLSPPDIGEQEYPSLLSDVDLNTGKFVIENVPIGDYRVGIFGSEDPDFYLEDVKQLGADGLLHVRGHLNLQLAGASPGGVVRGVVDDPRNGAIIALWPDSFLKHLIKFVSTDEGGNYEFRGVKPGAYHVAAFDLFPLPGFGITQESRLRAAKSEKIEVQSGGTEIAGPRLKVNREKEE